MKHWFRPRIRHPFFPGLTPTPAHEAKAREVALLGSFADLTDAARRGASAARAIFVLLDAGAQPLDDAQRDRLWNLFEAPVYAIVTGPDGRAAAYECEMRSGFHVPTRPDREEPVVCECGRAGAVVTAASRETQSRPRFAGALAGGVAS